VGKVFEALTKTAKPGMRGDAAPMVGADNKETAPTKKTAAAMMNEQQVIERIGAFDEKLIALNESFSPVTESFRRLRTKLLHPASGKTPRSILITSVAENEGKGFVAANFAVTIAQGLEQYALLVDCDLRRPSLAGQFGLSNEKGLADHLQHETDLSLLIKPTGIPKLSLIPAGPPPGNPSELLVSDKMTDLINELMNRYPDRFVIFDSPPLQAASEITVLAKKVDAAVLVIRWGGAGRDQVKKLTELLGKDKIAGVVFNGVQVNNFEYGFKRYRGYHEYSSSYHR
jgi:protein-tyrosine kinase